MAMIKLGVFLSSKNKSGTYRIKNLLKMLCMIRVSKA